MIYLGGGGSEHDESQLWDEVFRPGARLAVWSHAMPFDREPQTLNWLMGALAPRGRFALVRTLRDADVLVIPGGNTFDLLCGVRSDGSLDELPEFLARGGHVYGGSAGAVLLGADIAIAGLAGDENTFVLNTAGLDLLAGAVVFPHHTADQEAAVRCWSRDREVTVLAIPETAGVIVDGTRARNAGPSPVHVVTPDAITPYAVGATFTLRGRAAPPSPI